MKKFLLMATLVFATGAQAAQVDWKTELENYSLHVETLRDNQLTLRAAGYSVMAIATCGTSAAMAAAAFIADTAPITGVLSEVIANTANPDYESWQKIFSLDSLAGTTRTAVGGAAVGVWDVLGFINLWLGGNEHLAFEQLAKTYASTIATANSLFASQSKCVMSYSKVLLTRIEMRKRGMLPVEGTPNTEPGPDAGFVHPLP